MALRLRARSGSGTRRKTRFEWVAAAFNLTAIAANTQLAVSLASAAALEEFPGSAVRRVVGSFTLNPSTSPVGASGYVVYFGICLSILDVNGNAVAWDPELQQEFPWMWHGMVAPQMGGTGVSDENVVRFAAYFRIPFDVRVARKVKENSVLLLIVKNTSVSAAGVQAVGHARTLLSIGH